jgi:hypothetical protein
MGWILPNPRISEQPPTSLCSKHRMAKRTGIQDEGGAALQFLASELAGTADRPPFHRLSSLRQRLPHQFAGIEHLTTLYNIR